MKPLSGHDERSVAVPGVGDRVRIFLDSEYWLSAGWLEGTVVGMDPYSAHRSFYWVELDVAVEPGHGERTRLISVLNPRHIQRI